MNNSFARLIDGMCATLRTEVIPRLGDEFARGQVFGVINLLNTFKVRGDWSVGFLAQQVAAQSASFADISKLLATSELAASAPPMPLADPPRPVTPRELETMRDEGNRAINALFVWLSAQRGRLPADLATNVERLLRQCMRAEIDIEMKNAPRPLFAEMSSGSED